MQGRLRDLSISTNPRGRFKHDGFGLFAVDGGFFCQLCGICPFLSKTSLRNAMEQMLVGIIAVALMIYLVVAMLRPEKF